MAKKKMKAAAVDDVSTPYSEMAVKWKKIDALLSGTAVMRRDGTAWLPQMERESNGSYARRLEQSFLFNAYADTVRKVSAKPFVKPVVVEDNEKLPDQLQGIKDDADRAGTNLTQLAREMFWIGINRGIVHLLVDYPQTAEGETRADEQKLERRPVLIPIWPDQIIGWQTRKGTNGETILSQVRIHETGIRYTEAEGITFDQETVDIIRVFTEDAWQIWEKGKEDKEYSMASEGSLSRTGVPIITAYFEKVDFMTADPPLEDLAWLNIEHWQSSSDQRNILRFARTGVWFLKGVSEEEAGNLTLGPSAHFWSKNDKADMKVVEHTGGAITAGDKDLTKLEERMQLMGLRPFLQQARGATATSQTINEARGETEIQAWIRSIEHALMSAYEMAAEWVKLELPEGFKIDIPTEFAISLRSTEDIKVLLEARKIKDIDRKTFLAELKRRRILGEDVEVDQVVSAVESEGPPAGEMGAPPFGEDEDADEDED